MKINLTVPGQFCAGLGDCITWGWINANVTEDMSFFARGGIAEMLYMWGCEISEMPQGAIDPNPCYRRELDQGIKNSRIETWADVLGLTWIGGIHPTIRAGFPTYRDPKPKRVLLCPHCNFVTRTWPAAYWLDLAWILKDNGYDVQILMGKDDKTFSNRGNIMAWWQQPIAMVTQLIREASLVIANDSMPAHLAGSLGVPTFSLMGPTTPNVFAHLPAVTPITSELSCTGCYFKGPVFRASCDQMCQSLALLTPQKIYLDHIVPMFGTQTERHKLRFLEKIGV